MFLMHHTLDSLNCDSLKSESLLGLGPMKLFLALLNSGCSFSGILSSIIDLTFFSGFVLVRRNQSQWGPPLVGFLLTQGMT